MKKISLIGLSCATLLLSACAGQSGLPVLTRSDASHETTGLGETKAKAQAAALEVAKKQCGHKTPIIISDKYTYNGLWDEKTGRMIEQGAGVVGAIFGKNTPRLSRPDDYEYTINFRCK